MSSADRTWTRGRTPPPASESRSLTPPPRTRESAVAVSGHPPFPLGGYRKSYGEPFRAADEIVYDSHGFALFPNVEGKAPGFDAHMEVLADLAMHEEWGGKDFNGNTHKFYLLRNYLKFSFMFIEAEQPDKRITSACGGWTAYDTRLVTKYEHGVEPILPSRSTMITCRAEHART